ncbi:MAG: DUF4034 domain-containing protein [Methylocella sp.]
MKIIATLFAIGLMAGCNTALAAEAGDASGSDLSNPFSGVMRFMGPAYTQITLSGIPGEDVSSPFNEAHPVEQGIYERLYYNHYHGLVYNENAPAPQELPSALDAKGRPLWFDGGNALQSLVMGLFVREQFDDLDHLFDDWSNLSDRRADGGSKLATFQDAMYYFFSTASDWDSNYQLIRRWREKTPKSRAAALTEALYWYRYAWSARGNGYASSVTTEGWKLFQERLQKAEAMLLESKPYTSSSPLWGRICIDVGIGLNWSKVRLLEIFRESTKREKYFYKIYTGMVASLAPRWGGDWRLVDTFVKDAVKNTQEVDGYSMYARLYWAIQQREDLEFNLFHDSLASWADMKRGFEDVIRNYPHSAEDINTFAAAACIAGDKETFQTLRFRIGKTITPGAWPSNYSLDVCEHKFGPHPL